VDPALLPRTRTVEPARAAPDRMLAAEAAGRMAEVVVAGDRMGVVAAASLRSASM